jgi:hypothetical protein
MNLTLFSVPLLHKRDVMRARQLTRHATNLVGLDRGDQLCISAAVFDLACQTYAGPTGAHVHCSIADDFLEVVCTPACATKKCDPAYQQSGFRLSKRLPATAAVPRDDLPWMLKQIDDLAPLDVFEEMRRINQDFLQLSLEQARLRGGPELRIEPYAA